MDKSWTVTILSMHLQIHHRESDEFEIELFNSETKESLLDRVKEKISEIDQTSFQRLE